MLEEKVKGEKGRREDMDRTGEKWVVGRRNDGGRGRERRR